MKQITEVQNKTLQIELIKEFGVNSELDGVLNLEVFNITTPKILWILKEGNFGVDYKGNTDGGKKATEEEAKNNLEEKQKDMQGFYDNVTVYQHWRGTFENISYVTHGIIEKNYKFDDITNIESDATIDGKYYINKTAFINVKKAPGASVADGNLIAESYHNHKDFILKQIETINPDIIINCSALPEITADLSIGFELNKDFNFVKTNDRLIINAYHPLYAYRGGGGNINSEEYVDGILKIVKENFA